MKKKFREYNPNQIWLMPPSLDEWIPADHPVHFFNEAVGLLDLSEIYASYQERRGNPPYDPTLMVKILLYSLSQRIISSRKIERALHENVAFRYLSGNQHPDHWTISEFRRRHHQALGNLFAQTVTLCAKAGLVKLDKTATDGTKIKANASKHSAMSYGRMQAAEDRLRQEIEDQLRQMEEADRAEDREYGNRRGDELPPSLSTPEKRREAIRKAKADLEEEAREKVRREQARREKDAAKAGKSYKPRNNPEDAVPDAKDQRNFTDPESRIMKNSDKAFIQAYNAQATVDADSHIIVAADLSNQSSDSPHLPGQIEQVIANTGRSPKQVLADAGYFSEDNLEYLAGKTIEALIPPEKIRHSEWRAQLPLQTPVPESATAQERMRHALRSEAGRAAYKLRQQSIEPVFGYMKEQLGLRQFVLRGLDKVRSLWRMTCAVHNLMKLHRAQGKPA